MSFTVTEGGGGLTPHAHAGVYDVAGSAGAAALTGRHYDEVVVVSPGTDAILTALAAVTGSTSNRVLLYVLNGTYSESATIHTKPFVDVVGESESGVIITTAGAYDTCAQDGEDCMWANVTVRHTSGFYYPFHIDSGYSSSGNEKSATMLFYGVTFESSGGGKSAVGIGLYDSERLIFVDCTFLAATDADGSQAGVFGHNSNVNTTAISLVLVNCTIESNTATGAAFNWQNTGSGQDDLVQLIDCDLISTNGYGVLQSNQAGGTGETFISIGAGCSFSTALGDSSFANASSKIVLPDIIPVLTPRSRYPQYLGEMQAAANTPKMRTDGVTETTELIQKASTFTNRTRISLQAQSNYCYWAQCGSTANGMFTGSVAYESVIGNNLNYPLSLWQKSVKRVSLTDGDIQLLEPTAINYAGVGARYTLDVNGPICLKPGSSVTPLANGDVVVEATNDTTMTFKLKGSDGTVRSGTLTLA